MTKQEVVNLVSKKQDVNPVVVKDSINGFIEEVKKSLQAGEPVFIRGFGTFLPKQRAEKKARNILKGESVIVPAHKVPYFKPASEFKELLK